MADENISRDEARTRSALLDTHRYQLEIDLSGSDPSGGPVPEPDKQFVSTSRISLTARAAGATHLDLIADDVRTATLDGVPLDRSGFTGARLPFEVEPGDHELEIIALCRYSRTGAGLHRFVDPVDDRVYLYTQFEVPDARRMYACFEQPDLKAAFTISVVAPQSWTVVSNAPRVEPTPAGEGLGRWDFAETQSISTYITAIVAGEYSSVHTTYAGAGGEVPMSIVCRQSKAEHLDADRIFATTQNGFEVFERDFGYPYPFGSYDQAFVPEYNMGAMENAGCITFRDEYLFRSRATAAQYFGRDNTILHELAHMWFGDLVTMTWWDDLWLNESFAEWAAHYAQSEIHHENPEHAWAEFCNSRKGWAYRQDQLPSTHPIAADMVDLDAVDQNFDGITYAKGASVLQQLVAFVGKDAFLAGVRAYFSRHAYGSTQLADLLDALAEASGRDLSGWSAEWLEVAGVNTMRPEITVADDGSFGSFAVVQTAPADHPTLRHHRLAIGLYDLTDGRLRRVHRVEIDVAGERTEIAELVGTAQPDLLLVNDGDLGYTKIRLDSRSLQTVVEHIHVIDSELTRALCWSAAWDMCRDAEMRATDFVELALRGVGVESDLAAVQSVLAQAQLAADSYTAPDGRADVQARLESGLTALLHGADPGSDHQLAFTRSLTASARSDATAEMITGWLAGNGVPDGLVVDADLRWQLVHHLARLGRLDDAAIDAELTADATITGEEAAAASKASRPDARAKAAAWSLAVTQPDVPNETQRKICNAFMVSGQDDVLRPYVDAYLELCEKISARAGGWAERGLPLQNNAVEGLFPSPLADRDFVDRLDAWLGSVQLSDHVRRTVVERRSAAVRALACQEADAAAGVPVGG